MRFNLFQETFINGTAIMSWTLDSGAEACGRATIFYLYLTNDTSTYLLEITENTS